MLVRWMIVFGNAIAPPGTNPEVSNGQLFTSHPCHFSEACFDFVQESWESLTNNFAKGCFLLIFWTCNGIEKFIVSIPEGTGGEVASMGKKWILWVESCPFGKKSGGWNTF